MSDQSHQYVTCYCVRGRVTAEPRIQEAWGVHGIITLVAVPLP